MRLVITASSSYSSPSQPLTPETPLTVSSETANTTIHFTPHSTRPGSTFSLTIATTFSRPIRTHNITWGNDFDQPIRKYLPPKWKWALGIVRWAADPGLEEGLEEDKPWVRGPAVGSFNRVHVSSANEASKWTIGKPVEESWEGLREEDQDFANGGVSKEDFENLRAIRGDDDAVLKKRRAWFNNGKKDQEGRHKGVVLPKGSEVRWEFFNGFFDLNKFALNLPGFQLNIMRYWDARPVRFVLKEINEDGKDGEVFAVITFTYVKDDNNDHGNDADEDSENDDSDDSGEYEDAEEGHEGNNASEKKDIKTKTDKMTGPVAEDVNELD